MKRASVQRSYARRMKREKKFAARLTAQLALTKLDDARAGAQRVVDEAVKSEYLRAIRRAQRMVGRRVAVLDSRLGAVLKKYRVESPKKARTVLTSAMTAARTAGTLDVVRAADREYVRDEHGRFGSGGGGGAAAKPEWKHDLPAGILKSPASKETWQDHYDKNPAEGGKLVDPEREKLHDEIAKSFIGSAKPAAPGEQKLAIMTMGGPASGKSTGLRNVDKSKYVAVDPDAVKEKLPEYKKAVEARYRGAAAMAHEESSSLAKTISARATEGGHHVIIDGTGANKDKFIAQMQRLKAQGYRVHVMMPHVDEETGLARALKRAERTGRHVPESFIKEAYAKIPRNFAEISKHADSFDVYNGKTGTLAWSKTGGVETHHDPEFVTQYKKSYF